MRTLRVALAALLLPFAAQATEIGRESHNFGLGLVVGYPTALSAKLYLDRARAVDMAMTMASFGPERRGLYAHGSHLWHPSVLMAEPGFDLRWHVGVGGVVWTQYWGYYGSKGAAPWYGHTAAGVRVPIGLDMDLRNTRVQLFADAALNGFVTPTVFLDGAISLGARYYF